MTTTPDRVAATAAILLHLGIAVFPLPASGLVAPPWFLALTAAIWLLGAVVVGRMVTAAPRRAWLVPLAVLAVWITGITIGEQLLGWTA